MTAELVLRWAGGSLDLMGWNSSQYGDFQIDTLADGTNWGSPESVRTTLRSAMRDGSRTTKERDNNRTIPLKLRVKGPSHSALAGGEEALDLIDGRRCELVWTPPGTLGIAPSVFVVDYADLVHDMNDLGYERGELFYGLTLSALPHAYTDTWITAPALVQTPSVPVAVDTCDATTGWTIVGGTLGSSGGKLVLTPLEGSTTMTATRDGAVDLTTDRYLAVSGNLPAKVEVLNGSAWTEVPAAGMDGSYYLYDTGDLADPTVDGLRFTYLGPASTVVSGPGVLDSPRYLTDIRKQSSATSTAGRQQLRAVEVTGSRRTPASLLVQSPTTGLGTVLAYGGPQYNPGVARGAVGARSTTGSSLSGTTATIAAGGSEAFEIPATDFYTGSHSLWLSAWAPSAATSGTVTATVTLEFGPGGGVVGPVVINSQECSRDLSMTDAGDRLLVLLGSVDLPGAELPDDSTAIVRVVLQWDSAQTLGVDEALLFNRTLGRLVVAEADTLQKVWIDAANLDRDHDIVFAGSAGRSEAKPLSLATDLPAWSGALSMTPGTTYLYVGTTGASDATVEATFRPAGNTHMPALAV